MISVYSRDVLTYSYKLTTDLSLLLFSSSFSVLGTGYEGFVYEIWIDSGVPQVSNYLVPLGLSGCVSGLCFFGAGSNCDCDYCVTDPSVFCIAKVDSPYLSSNSLLCSSSSLSADVDGNCRECPSYCYGDVCISNYQCMNFCIPPCNQCIYFTYCTSCTDSMAVAVQGECLCNDGYFMSNFECFPCLSTCKTCTSLNTCSSCLTADFVLAKGDSGGYVCKCKFGMFLKETSCIACDYQCIGCKNNKTDCVMCRDTNSLIGISGCECKPGFYKNNLCMPCNLNCTECLDYSYCTACIDGYILKNNECVANETDQNVNQLVCNLGYFVLENHCLPCKPPCENCVKYAENCASCIVNAELSMNYGCRCIENYFYYNNSCVIGLFLNISVENSSIVLNFNQALSTSLDFSYFTIASNATIQ